jgi:hypothetical protein
MLWQAAKAHIRSKSTQKKFVDSFKIRSEENKKLLLGMKEFREFLKDFNIDEIINDFQAYNDNIKNKNRHIDLENVRSNFEKLKPRSFFQTLGNWFSLSYWFSIFFKSKQTSDAEKPNNSTQNPVQNSSKKIVEKTGGPIGENAQPISKKDALLNAYFEFADKVASKFPAINSENTPKENFYKLDYLFQQTFRVSEKIEKDTREFNDDIINNYDSILKNIQTEFNKFFNSPPEQTIPASPAASPESNETTTSSTHQLSV